MSAGVMKLLEVAPSTGLVTFPLFPIYHWKVGEVPEVATVRVVVPPLLIVVVAGCEVIPGGVTITVTVAASELADPAKLLARAQKLVVVVKTGVVKLVDCAPDTGFEVSPDVPTYH